MPEQVRKEYQKEVWEDSSELTQLQRKMFICNKLPIYRLPLLYPLEPAISYTALETALFETIKEQAALQVKYSYEPTQRRFYQQYVPLQREEFKVGREYTDEEPRHYIERKQAGIDLSKDYPWRLWFLERLDRRYLYIEFHHIAIDGLGIRCFEEALFNRLLNGISGPPADKPSLTTYRKINELQQRVNIPSGSSPELLRLPMLQTEPAPGVGRLTKPLDQRSQAAVERTAKKLGVTKNAVYQGILEEVLSHSCTGQAYGTIGNWRLKLGNFDEVGCYVQINPKLLRVESNVEERIRHIFMDNLKSLLNREVVPVVHAEYPLMYSYEEDMFRHFQYIPADRLCKFELYFRVYCHDHETGFEVEYSRAKYTDEQMIEMTREFRLLIDSLVE
ncbi:hypothetical protein H1230_07965 [Paenibacillus sp. 19GGS1-52]|uniref:condensation domain-containing protein n=1 Tax=Paenibacillus sp. 19GGS1-52 TaxID=2758563 RepID=UPI001EFB6718|nr:condensation domain-containing protein [Paenibacillus sp. 19GGS1-52]ULO08710.1 hypothetical protein H1230_07965 [Paenibacillus sp. 19GGS1-52]